MSPAIDSATFIAAFIRGHNPKVPGDPLFRVNDKWKMPNAHSSMNRLVPIPPINLWEDIILLFDLP